MLIQKETILALKDISKISNQLGIETIIIEPELIRGCDVSRTLVMLKRLNLGLSYPLGIGSIKAFTERLNFMDIDKNDSIRIDGFLSKNDPQYIKEIEFNSNTTESIFVGIDPSYFDGKIEKNRDHAIPRSIPFNDYVIFETNVDLIAFAKKIESLSSESEISFICKDGSLKLSALDVNNKKASVNVAKNIVTVDGEVADFSFKYDIKNFTKSIKFYDGKLRLSTKGLLKISNDLVDIYVIPKV